MSAQKNGNQNTGIDPDQLINEEEFQKVQAALSSLDVNGSIARSAARANAGTGAGTDAQISALLDEDRRQSRSFAASADYDFVSEVSIFDPILGTGERDDMSAAPEESAAKPKKERKPAKEKRVKQPKAPRPEKEKNREPLLKRFLALPMKAMYLIAGCIAALIVVLVACAAIFVKPTATSKPEDAGAVAAEWPAGQTANANFIFVNKRVTLGGRALTLTKMSISPGGSVFWLDRPAADYAIALSDQGGAAYARDLSYVPSDGRVAAFLPFDANLTGFSLAITDERHNETAVFDFAFDGEKLKDMPRAFVNAPLLLTDDDDSARVILTYAEFTASGAILCLAMNGGGDLPRVTLFDGAYSAALRKNSVFTANFEDGVTLVRLSYEPLRSIGGKIRLEIDNLFRAYEINETIEAAPLLDYKARGEFALRTPLEGASTVIEGMERQGGSVVAVLHTDMGSRRVETRLDADLLFEANGKTIAIHGDCFSGAEGADVLFKLGGYAKAYAAVPRDKVYLRINGLSYNMGKRVIEPDLTEIGEASRPEGGLGGLGEFVESSLESSGIPGAQVLNVFADDENGKLYAVAAVPDGSVRAVTGEKNGGQWRITDIQNVNENE